MMRISWVESPTQFEKHVGRSGLLDARFARPPPENPPKFTTSVAIVGPSSQRGTVRAGLKNSGCVANGSSGAASRRPPVQVKGCISRRRHGTPCWSL
jgi:hypothetical protein